MPYIKLINDTDENIRVAIFKKPYKMPSLKLVAWKVEALPQNGGNKEVEIPTDYKIYVNHSSNPAERDDPNGGTRTALIPIVPQATRFLVTQEKTNDNQAPTAILKSLFTDVSASEMKIENQASFDVWGHILLNGHDVYPPRLITPGNTLIEDVRTPLYLAVINESVVRGDVVKVEELSSAAIDIITGDTITVNGNKWNGYGFLKTK